MDRQALPATFSGKADAGVGESDAVVTVIASHDGLKILGSGMDFESRDPEAAMPAPWP
jgi:hypothetical protein